MKNKKLFLSIVILTVIMCFSISVIAIDISGDSPPEVLPAADQYPVYAEHYDDSWVDTDRGSAIRGYETGGLFNFWRSRAFTEVWGDPQTAVYNQEAYVYARIRNFNTGSDHYNEGNEMNTDRYCGAYTPYISPKYATHLDHEAMLTINGVNEWTVTQGRFSLPQ